MALIGQNNRLLENELAGGAYTVDNGLTEDPAGNFQLGGTLIENTSLSMGTNTLAITGGNTVFSANLTDGTGTSSLVVNGNGSMSMITGDGLGDNFILRCLTNVAQLRMQESGNGNSNVSAQSDGTNPVIEIASFNDTFDTNHSIVVSRESVTVSGTVSGVGRSRFIISAIDEYADNAAAIVGGLPTGTMYRTGDILKIVH